jgi:AcrR family transcriptional regulator
MSPRTKAQFEAMQDAAREKILDAGLLLFAMKGPAAAGVTEIAREAGVSLGLLYHYYASKEDLFSALVSMALQGAREALKGIGENEMEASEQIKKISRMVCGVLRRENKTAYYFLLLTQAGLAGISPENDMQGVLASMDMGAPFMILQNLISTGQAQGTVKAGDPRQLAQLYWAAFQGLCLYKITMRSFMPPAPEQLDGILLSGRDGPNK